MNDAFRLDNTHNSISGRSHSDTASRALAAANKDVNAVATHAKLNIRLEDWHMCELCITGQTIVM